MLSRMLGKEKPIDRWTLATLLVLFVCFLLTSVYLPPPLTAFTNLFNCILAFGCVYTAFGNWLSPLTLWEVGSLLVLLLHHRLAGLSLPSPTLSQECRDYRRAPLHLGFSPGLQGSLRSPGLF